MLPQLRFPQTGLIAYVQSACVSKAKIGYSPFDKDFADEQSTWVPDIYAVHTTTEDISFGVALDTVWATGICKCKKAAISKKWSYITKIS